jgi:hypothetical protein
VLTKIPLIATPAVVDFILEQFDAAIRTERPRATPVLQTV